MAPSKRNFAPSDDEDDDFIDNTPPPETGLTNGNKRQRRTERQTQGEEEESEDGLGDRSRNNGLHADEDEDDDEDEEMNEEAVEASTQRAARRIESKNSQFTENTPADFGIVTNIELENFMCHQHLDVSLGPLINFVIGHNGSGKSAILTALTLCLGGKATSTNRGSSLKAFIREGQSQARITLKLKNGGDGYKREVYGNIIIIERSFTREGSSAYKLKSKTGKLISNKREELDEICDFMGIQVDNPMNILTQDAARQFINSASEKEKYKFFLKGVQLEQLDQDYRLLMDSITNAEATLETKEVSLDELKKSWEEAKKKLQLCKGQQQIRDKMTYLAKQMAWVQVANQEKALEQMGKEIQTTEARIEKIRDKIYETDRAYDEVNRAVDEASAALAEEKDKSKPLNEEQGVVKSKLDATKRDLIGLTQDQRGQKGQIQAAEKSISELERQIEEEKRRLAAIDGGSNARLVAQKEEAVRELEDLDKKVQGLEEDHRTQQQELRIVQAKAQEALKQIHNKDREIGECRSRVTDLRNAQQQYMAVYGNGMPSLLREIEKLDSQGRWVQRPIGPLGQHIRLKKPDWSSILETVFGATLNGFLVTNYADQTLLAQRMASLRCNYPVFVCNDTPIPTPQVPDERYVTVMDVLEFSNPLVKKQLIIQSSIEQSLLFEDQEDAAAAWSTVTEHSRKNIRLCYAKNQGREGWGHRVGGRVGAQSLKPVRPWQGGPRMKTDLDLQLRNINHEISRLERERQDLVRAKSEKDQIVNELQISLRSFDSKKRTLRLTRQRLEDRIEKLTNDLEENVADNRLGVYENSLADLHDELRLFNTSYEEMSSRREVLQDTQAELKEELDRLDRAIEDARKKAVLRERELSDIMQKRHQALSNKNHWYVKMEAENKILEEKRGLYTQRERIVQEHTEKALTVCPRVELDRGADAKKLDETLGRLRAELKESERRLGGSPEEIADACTKATENYSKAKKEFAEMQDLIAVMMQSYKDRTYRWKKFRHYISARARAQFMWLMSQRAYRGRLRIDHVAKELKLEVQPNQQESDTGRGPKTLSGGEKSFSTVCLLLSLWEAMGSPIRCLDEFDVFMDPVNRKISVTMMIGAARRSIGKQFILITPQDMSTVDSAADVKVTRLRDPERNQTVLNI